MNISEKIRLLIIETDLAQREIFRTCCQSLNDITVDSIVPNGRLALDKTSRQAIDVILLDHAITDFPLGDFTKKVIGLNPDIGIILCSGYDEHEAMRRFSSDGPVAFLQKPFLLNDLEAKLRRALATRPPR